MAGMHRSQGTTIDGLDHLTQSMTDIVATPVGSLVGRRDYGSLIPGLIDQPMTPANILRIFAAAALALSRWENRIRVRRIQLLPGDRPGAASLTIEADRIGVAASNRSARLVLPLLR